MELSEVGFDGQSDEPLFAWFRKLGGAVNTDVVGVENFPDTGRGMVALGDIIEDEVLFEIPRDVVLSTRTSELPRLLGDEAWKELGTGWAGLILCMMWEAAKGDAGKWSGYLASLPTSFTTLMFWSDEELSELKGSMVLEKIGRSDAEVDYNEKVLPLLQKRPDLFPVELHSRYYSMEMYHINGSRILSRSFHVEKWKGGGRSGEDSTMDVDELEEPKDEDEDEEKEDPADVGMTPMADLLNARHGCDNARLFYEKDCLKMITTKSIKAGEQIWNTYGDPPNSDLLRRYGYVDWVPTPEFVMGNPADVVEIKADLVVNAMNSEGSKERIDFFLEEGGDDVFVLDMEFDIPEELLILVRLLQLPDDEWRKIRDKGKLPKPKVELAGLEIVGLVLKQRLSAYSTTAEVDEDLVTQDLPLKHRNAVIVRLGEKRILHKVLDRVEEEVTKLKEIEHSPKKRKQDGQGGTQKKSKRGI